MNLLRKCERPECDLPPVEIDNAESIPNGFTSISLPAKNGRTHPPRFLHYACASGMLFGLASVELTSAKKKLEKTTEWVRECVANDNFYDLTDAKKDQADALARLQATPPVPTLYADAEGVEESEGGHGI